MPGNAELAPMLEGVPRWDIGCDKGAPVTDEYEPLAAITGKIIQVKVDLHPDLAFEAERHTAAHMTQAMARQ